MRSKNKVALAVELSIDMTIEKNSGYLTVSDKMAIFEACLFTILTHPAYIPQ